MSVFTKIELPRFPDDRGVLTVLQNKLPFEIRRVFWISDADGLVRGGHRHRKTRQCLIAMAGTVTVHMDNGIVTEEVILENSACGLIVEPTDWHTMAFGTGATLLVFASEPYDRADYIDTPYLK